MQPWLRKLVLFVHLTVSLGWIGAIAAYIVFELAALSGGGSVAAMWSGLSVIGWSAIVPLAVAAWLTGLVVSLGTQWGVLQHYWVLISFVLTTVAVIILVGHMLDVSASAAMAAAGSGHGSSARNGDLLHAGAGLAVLLVVALLNVYKPRGMTPYGWRRRQVR